MRYLLFICFFVGACSGSDRPENVLPQEKMQEVLYDIMQADEMVDFLKLSDSTYQPFSRRTALYDTIFQLHRIRKEAFQQSMRFYQGRPDLLKEILESMYEKATDTTLRRLRPPV